MSERAEVFVFEIETRGEAMQCKSRGKLHTHLAPDVATAITAANYASIPQTTISNKPIIINYKNIISC